MPALRCTLLVFARWRHQESSLGFAHASIRPAARALEQCVPDHLKLLWLEARQGALNQPAIVDGPHLVDQRIRVLLEATGRSNTNPERFGGLISRTMFPEH